MIMVPSTAWCVLFIFLRSIRFCCGQSNSSNSSSGSGEVDFPVIVIGKDSTTLWYTNVSFGTPNVQQELRIDIGQPYTWLVSSLNESESAVVLNDGHIYDLNFMNGVEVKGPAVMDTVNFTALQYTAENLSETNAIDLSSTVELNSEFLSISNISIFDDVNSTSSLSKGSLGLGAKITNELSEIDSTKFDSSFYFLDRLTALGVIKSASYSLWLGADNVPYSQRKLPAGLLSDCGKLILGAVDPTLFTGKLLKFDMIPYIDPETHLESRSYPILPMGTIYIKSANGKKLNMTSEEFSEPVLLDTRYSTSYLPIDAIVQIAVQIGATYVESLGRWVVACSVAKYDVQLDFFFGDIAITVPLEDFLVTTYDTKSNSSMHFSNGDEACLLAMGSRSITGFNILGGPFLKNAYMAFDLEDESMALAQAKRQSSISDSSTTSSATTTTTTTTTTTKSTTATTQMSSLDTQIRAISSGYIPYAESKNSSINMTLFPASVSSASTNIPDLFTGAIDSDGLISTGRSFYQTSRSTTSSKTTMMPYETLLISSLVSSSSLSGGTNSNSAAFARIPTFGLESPGGLTYQILAVLTILLLPILL